MKTQVAKEITVLARGQHKSNSKAVCYKVLSSNEVDQYETIIYDGKASHCNCPATVKCYHMRECEKREAARQYDVVGAALQVVKQAEVDAQCGDFYETITREELETRRAYHDLATGYDSMPGLY